MNVARESEGRVKVPFHYVDSQTNVGQGLARASVLRNVINHSKAASHLFVIPEMAYFAVVECG